MIKSLQFGRRFIQLSTNEIAFFVNGKEYVVEEPDPNMLLSDYLRDGLKIGCETGVCGSCTVVVQDEINDQLTYKMVNSCMYPLHHADGKHIITPEVSQTGDSLYAQIQEQMAGKGGSQCGFCSPGVMMMIYSEILNNPEIQELELDLALNNNQCRCTGYRPILHAVKDVLENPDLSSIIEYPSVLRDYDISSKKVSMKGGYTLIKPSNLEELVKSYNAYPGSSIIAGGIEGAAKTSDMIDTTYVKEFSELEIKDSSIVIGSAVSLEELAVFSQGRVNENGVFEALNECAQRLATKQIRNMGSVVGNIFNKDYIPEILMIVAAVDGKVKYLDLLGKEQEVAARDLLKHKNFESLVVTGMEIPLLKENELLKYQKVAGRYYSSIPIVNSCFFLKFDPSSGNVEDCRILYGGILSDLEILRAKKTREYLIGKSVNDENVIESSYQVLIDEIKDLSNLLNYKEGKVEYRQTLALSMLKKSFYQYQKTFNPSLLGPREQSSLNVITKTRPLKTKIEFEEVMQGPLHGKAMDNFKALLLTSGDAEFVDDIPKYEGELCSYIVTSKIPHGKILELDGSQVINSKGVHAFITYKDIEARGGQNLFGCTGVLDEEFLASETVQAVGQPIAIIVAETLELAKEAEEKMVLEIEELPHLISIDDAREAHSYFDFFPQLKQGDVEQALGDSKYVIEGRFEIGGQDHSYLETHNNIVVPTENEELLIYAATQDCGGLQKFCSSVLNVPQHKLVVKTKRMGGGFGGKQSRGGFFAILNALAATTVKRPCRLNLDRSEDIKISGGRHPFLSEYKIGFDENGKIDGMWLDLYLNGGYCTELSWAIMDKAILCVDQAYNIENLLISSYCCKTNTVSNTAFRGFGAPQSQMIMEEIIEQVAGFVKKDPYEVRKLNMYKEGDFTPFGLELNDCHLDRIWDKLHKEFDYPSKVKEIEEFNKNNKYRKRGIHLMPAKAGMGYCDSPFLNVGASLVHIYGDGSVLVSIGGTEMGQGLYSKIAQVCASQLGLPIEKVNVIETSTDKTALQPPTAASIGSDVYGGATVNACEILLERLEPVMKEKGYPDNCSWEDLILDSWFKKVNLTAHGYYEMHHVTPPPWEHEWIGERWRELEPKLADPFPYLIYGGVATEVEVDCLTGETRMLRADLIEDAGDSINPYIDIGQVEGSFVQGMGYCTSEEVIIGNDIVDFIEPGETLNDNWLKYILPLSNEIPEEFNVSLLNNCGTKWHHSFMSSKTSGEPPFFLGQSVFFAIRNAILDFRERELGIVDNTPESFVFNSPATTERIRMACSDDLLKLVEDTDSFKAKAHI